MRAGSGARDLATTAGTRDKQTDDFIRRLASCTRTNTPHIANFPYILATSTKQTRQSLECFVEHPQRQCLVLPNLA